MTTVLDTRSGEETDLSQLLTSLQKQVVGFRGRPLESVLSRFAEADRPAQGDEPEAIPHDDLGQISWPEALRCSVQGVASWMDDLAIEDEAIGGRSLGPGG